MVSALNIQTANPVEPVGPSDFGIDRELFALLEDKFGFEPREAQEIIALVSPVEAREILAHLKSNPELSVKDVMALFNLDKDAALEITGGKDSIPVYGLPLSKYGLLLAALFASDSAKLRSVLFKMFEKSESIARKAAKDIMASGFINLAGGVATGLLGGMGVYKGTTGKSVPGTWWSPMGVNVGAQAIGSVAQGAGTVMQGRAQLTESEADPIRQNTQILQSIRDAYERKETEAYALISGK